MWCLPNDKSRAVITANEQIHSAHRECRLQLPETAIVFFMSKDTVPEGVGFSTFGVGHLIWLVGIIAAIILATVIYKRLDEKGRKIMRLAVGGIILFLEISKNFYHIIMGEFSYGYLPFHLCGINILLIAFDMIKPTKIVRNFLYYFSIAGATLALNP